LIPTHWSSSHNYLLYFCSVSYVSANHCTHRSKFVQYINMQSFEALNPRAVAVVIDPIQSVKGKVVIDAFRLINPQTMMLGQEPRQTTSNVGHLNKPSIQVNT
jgi:hypothetical protein